MFTLYHLWLSPFCRAVRLVLAEKGLEFELVLEKTWERRDEFLRLNPAGDVPVLVTDDGATVTGYGAVCEYLEEVHPEPALLGANPLERAETRRLAAWFGHKFDREVTEYLVGEKLMKRLSGMGQPDSNAIRAGRHNIHHHLEYIAYLAERRNWLAGEAFGLADIMAGAQLSCVDYIGDVPWDDHAGAHDWYARIKSRPSFRAILGDQLPGLPPPRHYADLDF